MKVYKNFKPDKEYCGLIKHPMLQTVATLGTFDGVHIGHRQILKKVIAEAKKANVNAVVLTFSQHPISVIKPDVIPRLLTTLNEKLAIFENMGIDIVFVLNFTKEIANMTARQFIKHFLIDCLGMNTFIIGYDHNIGKDRNASTENILELSKKLNFNVDILQPVKIDGVNVKSSIIRNQLLEGEVDSASVFLVEYFSLSGKIVRGRGIGKKIGFPTANLIPENTEKIIPANGVYAGWAEIEDEQPERFDKLDAAIMIGPCPTFDLKEELIEVHIPDYKADLYNKVIRVGFIGKLRNIEKFASKNELIEQIRIDIDNIKNLTPNELYK